MTTFEVWAPRAEKVSLWRPQHLVPMLPVPEREGWWRVEDTSAGPGADYAYILTRDGEDSPPRPDPRSRYQPAGVHKPSRVMDDFSFVWKDEEWRAPPLASGVIYELHVGTFTPEGTFAAAIGRLDHLVELGVTHVEVMSIASFPGDRGWGYDGVALSAPHPAYCRGLGGEDLGPDAVKAFVNACHAQGLAVLLDVVYNHLGPSGNYLGEFGPYFTQRYSTPWGDAVNLDGAYSHEVRRFFIESALGWMNDYHFDGLRIDAVHALRDLGAVHFLEELKEATTRLERRLRRPLVLIAESDLSDPRMVRGPEIGGYGMDAQWADEFHHALHALLSGEVDGYYEDFGSVSQLAKAFENPFIYDGQYSPHRKRPHGRSPVGLGGEKFCVFSQNHDQVGNRARGERLTELVGEGKALQAIALVFFSPYVPMLFMGEEWGTRRPFQYFTAHEDQALAEAVREGRRSEFSAFGWKNEDIPDPQAFSTFEASTLDWSEPEQDPCRSFLARVRDFIRIRQLEPAFVDQRRESVRAKEYVDGLNIYRGDLCLAVNFSSVERVEMVGPGLETLWASVEGSSRDADGWARLPPDSATLFRVDSRP